MKIERKNSFLTRIIRLIITVAEFNYYAFIYKRRETLTIVLCSWYLNLAVKKFITLEIIKSCTLWEMKF